MLHTRASRTVAVLLCLSPAALRAEDPLKTSEVAVYGRLNISFDYGSQGFGGITCNNANSCGAIGQTPQGVTHWLPDVASNLSRFGVRGSRWFIPETLQGIFQLEAEVAAAATWRPFSAKTGRSAFCGTLIRRSTK